MGNASSTEDNTVVGPKPEGKSSPKNKNWVDFEAMLRGEEDDQQVGLEQFEDVVQGTRLMDLKNENVSYTAREDVLKQTAHAAEVRSMLILVASAAKKRVLDQVRKLLLKLLNMTIEEVKACESISVTLFAPEFHAAIHACIGTNVIDIVTMIGYFFVLLSPRSLNCSFGISKYHIIELDRLDRPALKMLLGDKFVRTKEEEEEEGPLPDMTKDEKLFFYGCEGFHSLSTHLDESVLDNLSYSLLSNDMNLVQQSITSLCIVTMHPMNRVISHEPQGLVHLCQDYHHPVTQYFAISCLGNLCLTTNDKLGEINAFASSIEQVMRIGLVELISVICNPNTKLFVLEAAVRALIMYAGSKKARQNIVRVGVLYAHFYQGDEYTKKHDGNRDDDVDEDEDYFDDTDDDTQDDHLEKKRVLLTTQGIAKLLAEQGDLTSIFEQYAGIRCPSFCILFYLIYPDHFKGVRHHYAHLTRMAAESELIQQLACILMAELSSLPENHALLHRKVIVFAPEGPIELKETYRELIFDLLAESLQLKKFTPSHVALSMIVVNLCQSRAVLLQYVRQNRNTEALIDPFLKLFSRRPEFGFDGAWRSFRTGSKNVGDPRNQLLSHQIMKNIMPTTNIDEMLQSLPEESSKQDVGFNELWIHFYQASLCDTFEQYIAENYNGQIPRQYVKLMATILETCYDPNVFRRIMRIITVLALRQTTVAEMLFEYGVVSSLVRILWMVCEDQGLLVLQILLANDKVAETELFPMKEKSSESYHPSQGYRPTKQNMEKMMEKLKESRSVFHETDEDFVLQNLGDRIVIGESFLDRISSIIGEIGISVTFIVIRAITSFTVHESLRSELGQEYRLRGVLYRLMCLFRLDESMVPTTQGLYADLSPVYPDIFPKAIVERIRQQLVIGVANLAPRNNRLSKFNWCDKESLTLLNSLVDMTIHDGDDLLPPAASQDSKTSRDLSLDLLEDVGTDFIRFKALCGIDNVCRCRGAKLVFLSFTKVLTSLGTILQSNLQSKASIKTLERVICLDILRHFTIRPDGMILWLKFESKLRMSIDSAGVYQPIPGNALRQHAMSGLGIKPSHRFPESEPWKAYKLLAQAGSLHKELHYLKAGQYAYFEPQVRDVHRQCSNLTKTNVSEAWGVKFAHDDFLVLSKGGVPLGHSWTIGVWFCTDFPEETDELQEQQQQKQQAFTLAQSEDGDCIISIMHRKIKGETFYELGTFDAESKTWYGTGIDMFKLVPGWHHLVVVGEHHKTMFFIDGAKRIPVATVEYQCRTNVFIVGNSFSKDQAFGLVADFRLYPYAISRDSADWDLFFDGRTWGVMAYPSAEKYPPLIQERAYESLKQKIPDTITSFRDAKDMPWYLRPPDYLRFVIATFEDGALLQLLLDEFVNKLTLAEQQVSSLILGDLCLCALLRNRILAMDAHFFFMDKLSNRLSNNVPSKREKHYDEQERAREQDELKMSHLTLCRLVFHDS